MFSHVLKQRKSYLDQFRKRQDLAHLINDDSMMDILMPQIQKLNMEPLRKKKPKPRPRSRSRSKSTRSLKQPQAVPKNNQENYGDSLSLSTGGDGSHAYDAKPRKLMRSIARNDYTSTSDSDNNQSVVKPASLTEMLGDYSKTLDLTEFERQCLGFSENLSISLTDEDDSTIKPKELPTDIVEVLQDRKPETRGLDQDKKSGNPDHMIKVRFEDMSAEGKESPEADCSNAKDDQGGYSLTTKLTDLLSLKSWTTPDENNNYLIGDESEEIPRKIDFKRDKQDSSFASSSTRNTNPRPHELLSTAIFNLLDDFTCSGVHVDGDNSCFECLHKDAFKSLAINYVDELHYIWANKGNHPPTVINERIVEVLEVWIYHLAEQNLQLGKAYNESVKLSEKLRTFMLQAKNSLKSQQCKRDIERSKIDALNYELSLRDQTINKLRSRLDLESDEAKDLKAELHEMQSDVESLTQLIIRLRDKGIWDIHGLPLGDKTFKKIFNGDYYLHGAKVIGQKEFSTKKKEWKNEIEQLKTESETLRAIIAAKDREIQKIKSVEAKSFRNKCGGAGNQV